MITIKEQGLGIQSPWYYFCSSTAYSRVVAFLWRLFCRPLAPFRFVGDAGDATYFIALVAMDPRVTVTTKDAPC